MFELVLLILFFTFFFVLQQISATSAASTERLVRGRKIINVVSRLCIDFFRPCLDQHQTSERLTQRIQYYHNEQLIQETILLLVRPIRIHGVMKVRRQVWRNVYLN